MQAAARNPATATIIVLCFCVAVIEGFDIQAIGVAALRIAPELGLAPAELGWMFLASNLMLVLGASTAGMLADIFGRKPVFIAAVLVFGLATFATIFAHDLTSLILIRGLAGAGFGAALPNIMAIAADISDPTRRARTSTLMFCGMPLGGGLSALLTQMLAPDFDWRVLFIIGGVLPLLLAPVLLFFLPETGIGRDPQRRVSLLLSLFGEARALPTLLAWLALLPTQLIVYLILYWLPTLAVAKGLDRIVAPQVALSFNFASVVGALLLGVIVDRFGARAPLTIAYGALIAALMGLGAAQGLPALLLLSGAAGFFLLGANYALLGVVASYYPANMRGAGSGLATAVGRIGAVIGPLLPGLLLSSGAGPNDILNLMAPAAAIAAAAVFMLSFCRPSGGT